MSSSMHPSCKTIGSSSHLVLSFKQGGVDLGPRALSLQELQACCIKSMHHWQIIDLVISQNLLPRLFQLVSKLSSFICHIMWMSGTWKNSRPKGEVAFYVGFLRYLLTMFSTVQGGLRRVVNMKLCETNNVSLQNSVISFHDDSLMYSTNLSARSLNNLFFGRRATC